MRLFLVENMTDKAEIEKRSKKEYNRLKKLLKNAGISDLNLMAIEPIMQNTAWMKAKLDDTIDTIKESEVVISYDNGGGQKGLRRNPFFDGYESLWKSYMSGMSKIMEYLPETVNTEIININKPKTTLELVRSKHKKEA